MTSFCYWWLLSIFLSWDPFSSLPLQLLYPIGVGWPLCLHSNAALRVFLYTHDVFLPMWCSLNLCTFILPSDPFIYYASFFHQMSVEHVYLQLLCIYALPPCFLGRMSPLNAEIHSLQIGTCYTHYGFIFSSVMEWPFYTWNLFASIYTYNYFLSIHTHTQPASSAGWLL